MRSGERSSLAKDNDGRRLARGVRERGQVGQSSRNEADEAEKGERDETGGAKHLPRIGPPSGQSCVLRQNFVPACQSATWTTRPSVRQ